jgi:hypothetical protein
MMGIRACSLESHHARYQLPTLALYAQDARPIIGEKVVSGVLAERDGNGVARLTQREHHGQCRPIAYILGMLHSLSLFRCSDGQRH